MQRPQLLQNLKPNDNHLRHRHLNHDLIRLPLYRHRHRRLQQLGIQPLVSWLFHLAR
jgi:hypothetical protein